MYQKLLEELDAGEEYLTNRDCPSCGSREWEWVDEPVLAYNPILEHLSGSAKGAMEPDWDNPKIEDCGVDPEYYIRCGHCGWRHDKVRLGSYDLIIVWGWRKEDE